MGGPAGTTEGRAPEGRGRQSRTAGIPVSLDLASHSCENAIMKTTIDIPDRELEDAMRFTGATTKREAVVTAIVEFNRQRRMAELVKYSGTFESLMPHEEMKEAERWRDRGIGEAG